MKIDYNAWARDYDETRRVSVGVASAVLAALGQSQARLLLDIGGGTGNFASVVRAAGFRVAAVDISSAMLRRARQKLDRSVELIVGNAEHLPFRDASFDCAICINVIRHIPNRAAALTEARRVLRSGPLVIRTTTKETEKSHWAHFYFPTLASYQPPTHTEDELAAELQRAGFSQVRLARFWYRDGGDGSFQALKYDSDALLDAARNQRVAVFKRLPRPELERGIDAIQRDLRGGRLEEVIAKFESLVAEYGDGIVAVAS